MTRSVDKASSGALAPWLANRVKETPVLAEAGGGVKYVEGMRFAHSNSWLHVHVRGNDRGRFVELMISNYETCNDGYLKVPEEDIVGKGWKIFSRQLYSSAKEKII